MGLSINWVANNKEWLFSGIGVSAILGIIWLIRFLRMHNAKIKKSQPITNIQPNEIFESIKDVPPLQRETILDQYKGLRIDWVTELSSAHKHWFNDSLISLMLHYKTDSLFPTTISCKVKRDSHKDLIVAKVGTSIRVVGEIEEVHALGISLKNAEVVILPANTINLHNTKQITGNHRRKARKEQRSH